MADRTFSGRMGVAVAVTVAVSLIAGVVLATTYSGVRTTTVVQTNTSTFTMVSTVTLTPTPIFSTITVTLQSPSRVSTNTTTSTASVGSTTSTAVSCTVSGEGGPVYIELLNGSSPVPGVAVDIVHRGPTVNGQYCGTVSLPALYTNSTGWVEIPGDNLPYAGSFLISFVYSSSNYNSTIQIQPVTTTYVYVSLPSGEVTTTNCVYDACPTMSDTMGMDG